MTKQEAKTKAARALRSLLYAVGFLLKNKNAEALEEAAVGSRGPGGTRLVVERGGDTGRVSCRAGSP